MINMAASTMVAGHSDGDGASAKDFTRRRSLWKSTVTVGLWRLTASCNFVLRMGARLAEPGEFTKRALLECGRIGIYLSRSRWI